MAPDSVLRHAVVVLLAIARCLCMVQAGLLWRGVRQLWFSPALTFVSFCTVAVSSFVMTYRTEVFFSRVNELGLESFVGKFREMGLTTNSKFALGSEYNPHMPDPSVLSKQLLEPIDGDKKDAIPALRMLWWEAGECHRRIRSAKPKMTTSLDG